MKQTTNKRSRTPIHVRLLRARERRGMTQTAAAAALPCNREHLSKFEHGRYHSPELAWRLSKLYGLKVATDALFEDEREVAK